MALSSPPGWSARLRLVAFIAHRRMPGDRPDGFLPAHARVLAPVRAKVAADRPLCP